MANTKIEQPSRKPEAPKGPSCRRFGGGWFISCRKDGDRLFQAPPTLSPEEFASLQEKVGERYRLGPQKLKALLAPIEATVKKPAPKKSE